ncbi:hypothetical protein J2T17_004344 [Paenibacillus mucilaginosus]|uniref:S-layer homology domain-containing protein n=1 Tax=Paenibacillus mucilaginosus TaxID=61624 RepID=UPI003D205A59
MGSFRGTIKKTVSVVLSVLLVVSSQPSMTQAADVPQPYMAGVSLTGAAANPSYATDGNASTAAQASGGGLMSYTFPHSVDISKVYLNSMKYSNAYLEFLDSDGVTLYKQTSNQLVTGDNLIDVKSAKRILFRNNSSSWFSVFEVEVYGTPSKEVDSLKYTATDRSVSFNWVAPSVAGLDRVDVYRDGTLIASVPAGTVTYTDDSAKDGKTYSYLLQPVYLDGTKSTGKTVSVLTYPLDGMISGLKHSSTVNIVQNPGNANDRNYSTYAILQTMGQINYTLPSPSGIERFYVKASGNRFAAKFFDTADQVVFQCGPTTLNTVQDPCVFDGYTPVKIGNIAKVRIENFDSSGTWLNVYEFDAYAFAPAEVSGLGNTVSGKQVNFTWANPSDSDFDHVNIYKDGVKIGESKTGSFQDSNEMDGSTHTYRFTTVDDLGTESTGISRDVVMPFPDNTPPDEVGDLGASTGPGYIELTWSAPANEDLSHYELYKDDMLIGTVTDTVYRDVNEPLGGHTYKVVAVDHSGNKSSGMTITPSTPPAVETPSTGTGQEPSETPDTGEGSTMPDTGDTQPTEGTDTSDNGSESGNDSQQGGSTDAGSTPETPGGSTEGSVGSETPGAGETPSTEPEAPGTEAGGGSSGGSSNSSSGSSSSDSSSSDSSSSGSTSTGGTAGGGQAATMPSKPAMEVTDGKATLKEGQGTVIGPVDVANPSAGTKVEVKPDALESALKENVDAVTVTVPGESGMVKVVIPTDMVDAMKNSNTKVIVQDPKVTVEVNPEVIGPDGSVNVVKTKLGTTDTSVKPVSEVITVESEQQGQVILMIPAGQSAKSKNVYVQDPSTGEWVLVKSTTVQGNKVVVVDVGTKVMVGDRLIDFSDLNGHWAEESITFLAHKEVLQGYDDQSFKPDSNVSRAEFTVMIVNALQAKMDREVKEFNDIDKHSWYRKAVLSGRAHDLVRGITEELFAPNEVITREQMVAVLVRTSKYLNVSDGVRQNTDQILSQFHDEAQISSWAKSEVAKGVDLGIVEGYEGDVFLAQKNGTRAEAAVLIDRLLQKVHFF